ncbi:STAS domain-containing protein [Nonomuraea basaltis]|uniref:STAS domain-containing protein n=1 Tax=Nonomuraea basaltis TaxID=2495887 RepID=UPI00110C6B1C|nr:STAS domain-containing protein [Nonomuraea basaltis]TMR95880.1 STAS domain-containing protein [Nonomuraea basaltis]
MEPLHLTTSRRNGTVTVAVSGELDLATTEPLRSHLLELLREAGRAGNVAVVIEVSRLSFIDAAGLGVLVSVRDHALRQQTPLRLAGVPPAMRRLLRITGLDVHLT